MAEHPSAALVRRMYDALFAGDPDGALGMMRPDVVWHVPGRHPASGDHAGRDAVRAAMRHFDGSVQLELHDVVANDDHAVALLHATGQRKGRRYDAREIDIFHVRDGAIAEFWSFAEDQRMTDEYWS
jgi:hypothetical protein